MIIEKLQLQLERLSLLEEKMDAMDTKMDAKIGAQTVSLQNSIESNIQSASAAYNLFVYLPKSEALADYTGDLVVITSESGNQTATAALKDDGANYSTTIYMNFKENDCRLSYNVLNNAGEAFATDFKLNITESGQVQSLKYAPDELSWAAIHGILQAGCADEFNLQLLGHYFRIVGM